MQLLLSPQVTKRLRRELRRARSQEIGGLLMGEHVRDELFRVVKISVQRLGGFHACFIRHPRKHQIELEKFFAHTGKDYSRFNYLGEWHSHPSFEPVPSDTDIQTMQSIVSDPAVGVNFLVLLIPKLGRNKQILATATTFRMDAPPIFIPLLVEVNTRAQPCAIVYQWLRKIFRF